MKRKLRAFQLSLVWLREWIKLSIHYIEVWEPQQRPTMDEKEVRAVIERIKTSVLRYEYERVESLREAAIATWADR